VSILLEFDIIGTPVVNLLSENPHIWDDTSQKRFNFIQNVKNLAENKKKINQNLNLDITYYFHPDREAGGIPNIILLLNFTRNAIEGRLYRRHCRIYETNSRIIFDKIERTHVKICCCTADGLHCEAKTKGSK